MNRLVCRCLRRAEALGLLELELEQLWVSQFACWETNWFLQSATLSQLPSHLSSLPCVIFLILPLSRSLREGCQSVYLGGMKIDCQYVSTWFYSVPYSFPSAVRDKQTNTHPNPAGGSSKQPGEQIQTPPTFSLKQPGLINCGLSFLAFFHDKNHAEI